MALKPLILAAPRWILGAAISGMLFLLGVTTEYAREQSREIGRLKDENQKQFEESYSAGMRERVARVEAMVKFHSDDMVEFRNSLKEFSRIVADHGSAVRELAFQVKQLGMKVEDSTKHQEEH